MLNRHKTPNNHSVHRKSFAVRHPRTWPIFTVPAGVVGVHQDSASCRSDYCRRRAHSRRLGSALSAARAAGGHRAAQRGHGDVPLMPSAELTPAELAFVWRARLMKCLWEAGFGLGQASLNMKLMRLSGGDTAAIAAAHAVHWSLTSAGKCIVSPAYGAFSDSTGRRWLWALGRLGMCVQFMTWWGCGSVRGFVIGHTFSWGVLPLDGSLKVEDAAWADTFGSRPDLSARLLAQNQVYTSLAGLVAPIVGAQLARYGENWAFICGIAIGALQCLLAATTPETLAKEKRLKFNASKINPLKGLGLLFTHGPGLRRLVIAGGLFRSCQTIYATIDSYRLGPIGWSPAEQSYYSAALSGVNIVSTQLVSKPLFARLGARRTFQTSSLVAAVAYLGVSQACRPVGAAAQMRRTLQFFLAKAVLMTPWSEPSHFAVLPMVVKQAQTAAPELGRGEITSAFGAVENLLSVATPVLWATTYAYFVKGQHSAAVVPLLLGPGGHFILAACLRCLSSLVLSTCDDSLLFLDS